MVDIKQQINNRFIKVVNHLILLKKAKTKAELARELGIKPNILSEILGGRMNVGIDSIVSLHEKYNISLELILLGKSSKDKSLDYLSLEEVCSLLETTPSIFKKYFQDKLNFINIQEDLYFVKNEVIELSEELKKQ